MDDIKQTLILCGLAFVITLTFIYLFSFIDLSFEDVRPLGAYTSVWVSDGMGNNFIYEPIIGG